MYWNNVILDKLTTNSKNIHIKFRLLTDFGRLYIMFTIKPEKKVIKVHIVLFPFLRRNK